LYLASIAAKGTKPSRSSRSSNLLRGRSVSIATLAVSLAALAGCGNVYRPVVSSINPVGPAAQPSKYAVVASSPSPTSPGLVTIVDFSGDTVLVTANLGVDPYYLAVNSGGTTGYTLNHDNTLTSFDISNQLMTQNVLQSTLLPGVPGVYPTSIYPDTASTYITEPGRNAVAQLQGTPAALKQELPIDPGFRPVYIAGAPNAPRIYSINPSTTPGAAGQVAAIETANPTISTTIQVGTNPVYGVMTADGKRAFIMNQGSNSVSVINAQTNVLDTPPAGSANPIVVGTAPVWADLAPTLNELVVANAGDGTNPGSVSIINIPLCSVTALPGNPNCDPNNPVDAAGFGQVLANVPVGVNPAVVAVLQDGSKAYVVNSGNLSLPCSAPSTTQPLGNCSVSVVNLTTNTVTATIPILSGHPNFIAATTGAPTGKVYVTSPESNTMTIIRTDTDTIQTTVNLQGKGVMVRVTAP
jgi:YVTN family beta-propeller protein